MGGLVEWIGEDVAPIGPGFAWAVRVRSTILRHEKQPWVFVESGCASDGEEASYKAIAAAALIRSEVRAALKRLIVSDGSGRLPLEHGGRVHWHRNTENQWALGCGQLFVGSTEVFFCRDVDALGFARSAAAALLGEDAEGW